MVGVEDYLIFRMAKGSATEQGAKTGPWVWGLVKRRPPEGTGYYVKTCAVLLRTGLVSGLPNAKSTLHTE